MQLPVFWKYAIFTVVGCARMVDGGRRFLKVQNGVFIYFIINLKFGRECTREKAFLYTIETVQYTVMYTGNNVQCKWENTVLYCTGSLYFLNLSLYSVPYSYYSNNR
jgi:hypothetical protein